MRDREPIYDEKIAPLMDQIIALCRKYDVPMVAEFQLNDDEEPLWCTTAIPTDWQHEKMDKLRELARGPVHPWMAIMISSPKEE